MAVRFGYVGLAIDQNCRYFKHSNPALNENTFTTTVRLLSDNRDATASATFLGQSLSLSSGEFAKTYTTTSRTGAAFPITFTANRIGTVYRSVSNAMVPIYQNISMEILGFLDEGLAKIYFPPVV
jgi:hypothetical protein